MHSGKIFQKHIKYHLVLLRFQITFFNQGEGDLPVETAWEFNGNTLSSDWNGIMISPLGARVSNLMIESVEGRHAGNYTCFVKNRAGTESFSAKLEVIGISESSAFWILFFIDFKYFCDFVINYN